MRRRPATLVTVLSLGLLSGAGCGGMDGKVWTKASVESYVQARSVWVGGQAKIRGELEGCAVLQAVSACRDQLSGSAQLLGADMTRRLTTLGGRADLNGRCRATVRSGTGIFASTSEPLTAKTVQTLLAQRIAAARPGTAALDAIWKACQPG